MTERLWRPLWASVRVFTSPNAQPLLGYVRPSRRRWGNSESHSRDLHDHSQRVSIAGALHPRDERPDLTTTRSTHYGCQLELRLKNSVGRRLFPHGSFFRFVFFRRFLTRRPLPVAFSG